MDLETLHAALQRGVADGIFSGAQAAIVRPGQETLLACTGHTAWPHAAPEGLAPTPIADDTPFDLASLTKALVTAPLAWHAIGRGVIDPDEPLARWLPEWAPSGEVTARHLLTHTSGLPAWVPMHRMAAEAHPADLRARAAHLRRLLLALSLEAPPGARAAYSDPGFMLLGLTLERALGGPLDALARDLILGPLGMSACTFVSSLDGERLARAAATEATEVAAHGSSLCGQVHDENAWTLGGIAGHAGLFGTAADVARFMEALLGVDGGPPAPWAVPPAVVRWAMSAAAGLSGVGGLLGSHLGGLDTPSGDASSAGPSASRLPAGATVGHLGFTGTSFWVDRARGVGVALLTNRVHPSRDREGIRDFRVQLHEAVFSASPVVPGWRPWPVAPALGASAVPRPLLRDGGRRELEVAVEAALRAGAAARAHFQRGREDSVVHKGAVDLVTAADLQCEGIIAAALRRAFPHHAILAEEAGADGRDSACRWIIDPIDGTTNFSHRLPHFCVCISLEVDGQLQVGVTYDVARDELFTARRGHGAFLDGRRLRVSDCQSLDRALAVTGFPYDRRTSDDNNVDYLAEMIRATQGIRRIGSAGLDMAWVAAGRLDLYWEKKVKPWDISAGMLLVEEAGGRLTDLQGHALERSRGEVLATCGPIHAEAVERLTRVTARRRHEPPQARTASDAGGPLSE